MPQRSSRPPLDREAFLEHPNSVQDFRLPTQDGGGARIWLLRHLPHHHFGRQQQPRANRRLRRFKDVVVLSDGIAEPYRGYFIPHRPRKRVIETLVMDSKSFGDKHLDTLREYLAFVLAARSAFSDRSSAILTVQKLTSELSSLHAREEKMESSSSETYRERSKLLKLEELKATIRTESTKVSAIEEYERIKVIPVVAKPAE